MAANLTTTYASQILDLLGLSKFKGGNAPPCPPPPIKISLLDTCIGLFPLLWGLLDKQFVSIGLLNFLFVFICGENKLVCTIFDPSTL